MNSDPRNPTRFDQVAQPGVVISNAWPQSRATEGATLAAIEEVLSRFPFFEAYQTVDVPFPAERTAIRRVLGGMNHPHTYTLTRVLGAQEVSLSSLDPGNRRRAVEAVIGQFAHAMQAGATTVAVISGSRPSDPAMRGEALKVLEDSLEQLADAIKRYDKLELLIEPLDYDAHKRNTLGTTTEAVEICERLASKGLRLALCIDTAHLILNGEDTIDAVAASRKFITEFHFCNPVVDRDSPVFGDHHLPFGPPGVVGFDEIATFMSGLRRTGYLSKENRPRVYCEVMQPEGMSSLEVVAHCQDALLKAWEKSATVEA